VIDLGSQQEIVSSQMLGLWLQTGAICVSAIAAILLILWTRRVACRRATLDILMQEQTNGDLISER